MKALTQSVLAAAMLLALPFAAAEACNVNAWNGNTSAATGIVAGGPAATIPAERNARYEELCSVKATSGQFVTDNTPSAEATYRARFYVLTPATGSAKVFSATSGQSNAGTEVVGVTFTGTSFTFSGVTGAAAVTGILPSRWYSVELVVQSGAAFSASVAGAASFTGTTSGTSPALSVESASLGMLSGTATAVTLDAFASTRSGTTPIGRLCKGDTNGDGSRNITDSIRARNEFVSGGLSPTAGQPDLNEDGLVNITDSIQIRTLFVSGQAACPAA
jgi:hypothetical protein